MIIRKIIIITINMIVNVIFERGRFEDSREKFLFFKNIKKIFVLRFLSID